MGKPYTVRSDSFCDHVSKALRQRFEIDLEFYLPKCSSVKNRSSSYNDGDFGVKLLKCSNVIVTSDMPNEKECVLKSTYNDYKVKKEDTSHRVIFPEDGIVVSRKDIVEVEERELTTSSFKDFVYKKLCERIISEFRESNKFKTGSVLKECTSVKGILLLKSAPSTVEDKPIPFPVIKRKPFKHKSKAGKISKSCLAEAAVTRDWVLNKTGTLGWCETKRPRVLYLKLTKKLSDGSLLCQEAT